MLQIIFKPQKDFTYDITDNDGVTYYEVLEEDYHDIADE